MNEWKCDCGKTNTGKFCKGCGRPKPINEQLHKDQENAVSMSGESHARLVFRKSNYTTTEKKLMATGIGSTVTSTAMPNANEWVCSCGRRNARKFCQKCGKPRPSAELQKKELTIESAKITDNVSIAPIEQPTRANQSVIKVSIPRNNDTAQGSIEYLVEHKKYILGALVAMLILTFFLSNMFSNSKEQRVAVTEHQVSDKSSNSVKLVKPEPPKVPEPPKPSIKESNASTNDKPKTPTDKDLALKSFGVYWENLDKRDFRAAYNLLTNKQQNQMGAFEDYLSGYDTMIENKLTKVSPVGELQNNRLTVDYEIQAKDRIDGKIKVQIFNGRADLIKEGKEWKIDGLQAKLTKSFFEK